MPRLEMGVLAFRLELLYLQPSEAILPIPTKQQKGRSRLTEMSAVILRKWACFKM
jgi:hypothetical protein